MWIMKEPWGAKQRQEQQQGKNTKGKERVF